MLCLFFSLMDMFTPLWYTSKQGFTEKQIVWIRIEEGANSNELVMCSLDVGQMRRTDSDVPLGFADTSLDRAKISFSAS